jgi:hypothetical protein
MIPFWDQCRRFVLQLQKPIRRISAGRGFMGAQVPLPLL